MNCPCNGCASLQTLRARPVTGQTGRSSAWLDTDPTRTSSGGQGSGQRPGSNLRRPQLVGRKRQHECRDVKSHGEYMLPVDVQLGSVRIVCYLHGRTSFLRGNRGFGR